MLYFLQRLRRSQHLWLLVSGLSSLSLFFLPFAKAEQATAEGIWSDARLDIYDGPLLLILALLAGLAAFGAIFLFKHLSLQARVAALSGGLALVLLVYFAYLWQGSEAWSWGLLASAVAPVFAFLSRLGIRADERLIKSMDRLR